MKKGRWYHKMKWQSCLWHVIWQAHNCLLETYEKKNIWEMKRKWSAMQQTFFSSSLSVVLHILCPTHTIHIQYHRHHHTENGQFWQMRRWFCWNDTEGRKIGREGGLTMKNWVINHQLEKYYVCTFHIHIPIYCLCLCT